MGHFAKHGYTASQRAARIALVTRSGTFRRILFAYATSVALCLAGRACTTQGFAAWQRQAAAVVEATAHCVVGLFGSQQAQRTASCSKELAFAARATDIWAEQTGAASLLPTASRRE